MADGPFALPDRWVQADEPPTWDRFAPDVVAFVRWRLDRWASLERLHALDQQLRASDGKAQAIGLHPTQAPAFTARRVRDVELARNCWAPTGLVAADDQAPIADPGEIALVAEGEVMDTYGPDADVDSIAQQVREQAGEGLPSWRPRGAAPGPWPLAFPTDVAVGGSRIAVADTGHNRVLVARPGGEILQIVGDGVPERADGPADEARFDAPRGVCWRGEELLVADTGNDAVRSVRPADGHVSTLVEADAGSLPAGLACTEDGEAVVALAGEGCLARLEAGQLSPIGEARPEDRHPVDLARCGSRYLVADLAGPRLVTTDGDQREVLHEGPPLVEPLGVADGEQVTVADAGAGVVFGLGGAEPEPISEAGDGIEAPSASAREADRLVVADAGGHHLWRIDPDTGESPSRVRLTESPLSLAEHIRLDPIEMAPGGQLKLSMAYVKRSEDGPLPPDPQPPWARGPVRGLTPAEPVAEDNRLRVEVTGTVAASGSLRIRWNVTGEDIGHEAAWDLPIVVRPGAEDELRLALSTSPP